jgi:hypothetical protein
LTALPRIVVEDSRIADLAGFCAYLIAALSV